MGRIYKKHIDKDGTYNMYHYAAYFYDNVQQCIQLPDSEETVYRGGKWDDFVVDVFQPTIEESMKRLPEFAKEIEPIWKEMDKKGFDLCILNLYVLGCYIKFCIDSQFYVLLEPTPAELIEEAHKLIIKNEKGKEFDISSELPTIIEVLKKQTQNEVKVKTIKPFTQIASKEVVMVQFIGYLTFFFKKYFTNVKRRANCVVTTLEQQVIRKMLVFFGFAPYYVSDSRYRQLYQRAISVLSSLPPVSTVNINEKELFFFANFLPYKIWKSGRIDDIDVLNDSYLKNGVTVKF